MERTNRGIRELEGGHPKTVRLVHLLWHPVKGVAGVPKLKRKGSVALTTVTHPRARGRGGQNTNSTSAKVVPEYHVFAMLLRLARRVGRVRLKSEAKRS